MLSFDASAARKAGTQLFWAPRLSHSGLEKNVHSGLQTMFTVVSKKMFQWSRDNVHSGLQTMFTVVSRQCSQWSQDNVHSGFETMFTVVSRQCSQWSPDNDHSGLETMFTVVSRQCVPAKTSHNLPCMYRIGQNLEL